MATVGSYEAKTHLPALLERVAGGETIIITKHGKPVARLVPVRQETMSVEQAVEQMKRFRDEVGPTLGEDLSIRALIEEGRRF